MRDLGIKTTVINIDGDKYEIVTGPEWLIRVRTVTGTARIIGEHEMVKLMKEGKSRTEIMTIINRDWDICTADICGDPFQEWLSQIAENNAIMLEI